MHAGTLVPALSTTRSPGLLLVLRRISVVDEATSRRISLWIRLESRVHSYKALVSSFEKELTCVVRSGQNSSVELWQLL